MYPDFDGLHPRNLALCDERLRPQLMSFAMAFGLQTGRFGLNRMYLERRSRVFRRIHLVIRWNGLLILIPLNLLIDEKHRVRSRGYSVSEQMIKLVEFQSSVFLSLD